MINNNNKKILILSIDAYIRLLKYSLEVNKSFVEDFFLVGVVGSLDFLGGVWLSPLMDNFTNICLFGSLNFEIFAIEFKA